MTNYEVHMEGWVTDAIYVTAGDKAEAVALATKEFNNRKGITESRVTDVAVTPVSQCIMPPCDNTAKLIQDMEGTWGYTLYCDKCWDARKSFT